MGTPKETPAQTRGAGTWAFLDDGFRAPARRSPMPRWEGSDALVEALEHHDRARRERLQRELGVGELDEALAALGGDPLRDDWHAFRPLRSAREETWSDWLATVLEGATPRVFRELFGQDDLPEDRPDIGREVRTYMDLEGSPDEHWRTDLLVRWTTHTCHVEVKTGDPNLDKTWDEAAALARRTPPPHVLRHFLLVLPRQADECERTEARRQAAQHIEPRTWAHVERALRDSLRRGEGTASWRALARVFVGALGQLLLEHPCLGARDVEPQREGDVDGTR